MILACNDEDFFPVFSQCTYQMFHYVFPRYYVTALMHYHLTFLTLFLAPFAALCETALFVVIKRLVAVFLYQFVPLG